MKPEEAPCSVVRRVDVSSSKCLRDEGTTHTESYPLLGGVFSDTKLSWLSRGPTLEIINTKDGSVIARWTFGAVIKDFSTKITCIEECQQPALNRMPQPLLQTLVGLECELTGGMVCVFNFTGPRVLRAINIPSKVTCMALISPGMEASTSLHPLLEPMDGIVAVGTNEGHIFLLDLRRADCVNDLNTGAASHWENLHDELRPCQVIHVRGGGLDQRMREFPNDHLCLHLNLTAFSHFKRFVVQFPRGDCKQFLPDDSSVTSMLYVPGLSSLIVGFAFGSFQIWSLKTLTHLYTCPTGGGPVERILFQEPCDDPNACCFVWISRGLSSETSNLDSANSPSVIMYNLSYDEKLWVHECGNVFNNFISCNTAFRFEFDEDDDTTGGRIVGIRTIEQPIRTPLSSSADDISLGSITSSLSLCLLVWETWGASGPPEELDPVNTHMAVFDLNQWYVDHMPPRLSSRGGVSRNKTIAGYVSKYRLGESLCGENVGVSSLGMLLDVNIDPTSLLPFTTVQNVEEHSRPSALQFRSVAFLERQIVHTTHPGIQRALLATLTSTGPSLLLTPSYVFHQCLALGLRPLQYDVPDCVNMELVEQRSYVILVALEHRLTRWLSACARECSDGRMEGAGLTLAWFLNVLWSRLADLKRTAVQLCVPLFDHSGITLDTNASRQLRHIVAVLRVLKSLFDNVTKEKWHLRLMDYYHIELQKQALDMEVQYYEALQWFIGAGLLPEIPENLCVPEESHVPYPAKSLITLYTARRTELQELYKLFAEEVEDDDCDNSKCDGPLALPQDLLMIDGLISHQPGEKRLQSEWERDAGKLGGRFAKMYPPASIQGLLRTYLIRDISYDIKTSIVTYIFMDLAATLDTDKWASNFHRFMQFPSAFNMSPSIIKLTQAFWHLDHRSFELALEMLLDPLISSMDIEMWQHRSVVRALMLQGQHRLALRYLSAREPPLNSDHDIRIRVNLLLSNDLVHEAFMFQRDFRSFENTQSLLEYFFRGCAKRQLLSTVLQLKLSEEEETAFVTFLESSKDMISEDLHVLYLLKRFRYVEAFDVNQRLRKAALESGRTVGSFQDEHSSTRDIVVNALYKTLPGVTRLLAAHCAQERSKVGTWKQVKRPTPLSVDVRQCQPDVKLKLPFIETALAKTREAWARVLPQTPQRTEQKSFVEQTPFLCTPRAKLFDFKKTTDTQMLAKTNPNKKRSREEDIEFGNLPASKLSRSVSFSAISHPNDEPAVDDSTGVLTPIVKRQSPNSRLRSRLLESDAVKSPITPTSIIKSRGSIGLTKSPMRMASDSSSRSRAASKLPFSSLSKSLLQQSETPEQTRPIVAKPPEFRLDVELTDDEEDLNVSVKSNIDNPVMPADKSINDSVISNDLESDHDGNTKYSDWEPFSLPVNSPPLARTPLQKRLSLSNMVVKANFLASTASWSTPGNRSSVTFGDNMVCVYDKDEPASTATNSSEFTPSADEDSRETNGSVEHSRDENSRDGESSREGEDVGTSSLAELRRRCHERVKPRSSSVEDLLNKSFEGSPDLALKVSSLDDFVPEDASERDEVVKIIEEENDFDTEPVFVICASGTTSEEVTDTSEKVENGGAEVTDDDSNDTELLTQKQVLSSSKDHDLTPHAEEAKEEVEKQESSLLFPLRCALLSPLFRSNLSRKSADESLKGTPRNVVETSAVAVEVQDVREEEDVVDIADSEKSNVSDSEDLGEVSGDVAAESLISNDLDSEEEEEEVVEEQPARSFWSFRLPSRSPSPAKAKTPERASSLSNRVLLSETLKRCHARVRPRPATFPEGQIYVRPEDCAKEAEEGDEDVASSSIPREDETEMVETSVSGRRSVYSVKSGSDFQVTEVISHKTSTSLSDVLKSSQEAILSTCEVSDDDSCSVTEEGEEATAAESIEPVKHSDLDLQETLSNKFAKSEKLDEADEVEQDVEDKNVVKERDSDGEMGELRVEDSDSEDEPERKSQDLSILVTEVEPVTPPNAVTLVVASTSLRTPHSAHLTLKREGDTPRSDRKSLRRTRLTEIGTSSGVRTRRTAAADPSGSPSLGANPSEADKATPGAGDATREEHVTPHRTRGSGVVELSVDEKPKSTRKATGSSVAKEMDVSEGTPRRTRAASVAKEAEVQEGTPRRTRSVSVAKEVDVSEGTPKTSGCKEADIQEETSRRTRGASVAKEVEVQEGTPRRARGASVVKEVDVPEGTIKSTIPSGSKEVEVTPRKTRGASVAKEVEAQERTPRRTKGASVVKEEEVQEGTPHRTRVASLPMDEVSESVTRRKRRSSIAKDSEAVEVTPRRTRAASVLKDISEDEVIPVSLPPSISASKEEISTPSRRTRISSESKEVEGGQLTPRGTRSHLRDEERPSTPRQTRSSSMLKERESTPLPESQPESQATTAAKSGSEPKIRGRGRNSSVAREVDSVEESSRKTRGSSVLKDVSPVGSSSSSMTIRLTRSSSIMSEKQDTPGTPKISSESNKVDETAKKSARERRGKTSELDSSFESKDGDTESVYSKRSNASHMNSPDSVASRTRTRLTSVSSIESARKATKSRKRKSDESSLVLQEKLAQISGSEASDEGTQLKKPRSETSKHQQREHLDGRSIYSEVTERLNHSESESEYAEATSPKKSVELVSRDRIEAAIQEYSSTRRLTRKQQALLSRSLEICAQPERFQQAAVAASTVSDVEEEGEEEDARSVSSVRSSVRLRRKRGGDGPSSPASTATTEILPGNEKGDTGSRRSTRRTSGSCAGSPSSVVSEASRGSTIRGKGRKTAAQRKGLFKNVPEGGVGIESTTSTEMETSSQASSRKILRGSRTSSATTEEETFSTSYPAEFAGFAEFAEPQYPASDVGSVGNLSPCGEGFTFSHPPVEVVEDDSSEVPAPRRTRQTRIAPAPSLGPIREESQSSTEKDFSSSKASSNDKRRSWHLFTPLTDEKLALAAKKHRQKQRKSKSKPTVTSAFPDRNRSELFRVLLDNDEDSDN